MICSIRERNPQAEIVGICTEPEDTHVTHGITAFPLTWERDERDRETFQKWPWRIRGVLQRVAQLPRIWRFLREVDLLVISGGGQLDEFWGGPLRQPYLLWIWTSAARIRRVPVVAFSVGWDYIRTALGRHLCIAAMKRATQRYVRDKGSLLALRRSGLRAATFVIPDAAFGLVMAEPREPTARQSPRRFIVVSPIAGSAVPPEFRATHARQMDMLAAACRAWIADGVDIRFVCSQPVMDSPWIGALTSNLPRESGGAAWQVQRESTVESYLSAVNGASFVVAARLHGLILALVAGTPIIGLNYSRKIAQLLTDFSQCEALMEPGSMTAAELVAAGRSLLAREDAIRADIVGRLTSARRELDAAHDAMMSLVGA
jgi:polysaccharide pyruvyl transferase WcaK-like protein